MRRRSFLGLLATLALGPAGVCSPFTPNFSGTWKQSNERCFPQRTGDVTRRIEHHGHGLVVETTIAPSSGVRRHATQRHSTDGRKSRSTGADGDEFHTSVIRIGQSLAFSVEEHEDGRIIYSKEMWTLLEIGSELHVDRETLDMSADGTSKQRMVYLRHSPAAC